MSPSISRKTLDSNQNKESQDSDKQPITPKSVELEEKEKVEIEESPHVTKKLVFWSGHRIVIFSLLGIIVVCVIAAFYFALLNAKHLADIPTTTERFFSFLSSARDIILPRMTPTAVQDIIRGNLDFFEMTGFTLLATISFTSLAVYIGITEMQWNDAI